MACEEKGERRMQKVTSIILNKDILEKAFIMMSDQVDENGKKIVVVPNKLYVSSNQLDIANKIFPPGRFIKVVELPILNDYESNIHFNKIVELVGSLICTDNEYDLLKNELKLENKPLNDQEREKIIIEINALIAKMYGLTNKEFEYILKTFKIIDEDYKQKILDLLVKLNS